MSYVVETTGLTKQFGERVAVDHVDLRILAGSAFGYLGPNGRFCICPTSPWARSRGRSTWRWR
jgi:hypothetical protein